MNKPALSVEPQDILAFAKSIHGQTLKTLHRLASFTVTVQKDRIWYTPTSTGIRRKQSTKALRAICGRFSETNSLKIAAYRDLASDASHTLALISKFVDSRNLAGNVSPKYLELSTNEAEDLINMIQMVLTPRDLKPKYRNTNATNPMYGHCYVATEALYYLLKSSNKYAGFKPHRGKDEEGVTHWWLEDAEGHILDPTKEQYLSVGRKPPYQNGRGGPFLTPRPSRRAVQVMNRVEDLRQP